MQNTWMLKNDKTTRQEWMMSIKMLFNYLEYLCGNASASIVDRKWHGQRLLVIKVMSSNLDDRGNDFYHWTCVEMMLETNYSNQSDVQLFQEH